MAYSPPAITVTGPVTPTYDEILTHLQDSMKQIYGDDVYLEPDSMDGQLIAVVALAQADANNAMVQAYNSFSPATAQKDALSNQVRINGIARRTPTAGTMQVTLGGTVGLVIKDAYVTDQSGIKWFADETAITIPAGASVIKQFTCSELGVKQATANTVRIGNPQIGWSSALNAAAVPGNPVETDAELRLRQSKSTALTAISPLEALYSAISSVVGITGVSIVENDTATTTVENIPARSIAVVVTGTQNAAVAYNVSYWIKYKKTLGCGTFGSTSISVGGQTINFSYATTLSISVNISLVRLGNSYTPAVATEIQAAVVKYISGLGIGANVDYDGVYVAAKLYGAGNGLSYRLSSVTLGITGETPGTGNVNVLFRQIATCVTANVVITET